MKVKSFMSLVNYYALEQPIFLQRIGDTEKHEVGITEFCNYYYDEKERKIKGFILDKEGLTVRYE